MIYAKTYPLGKRLCCSKFNPKEKRPILFRKGKPYNVNAKYEMYYPNILTVRKTVTVKRLFQSIDEIRYLHNDLPF